MRRVDSRSKLLSTVTRLQGRLAEVEDTLDAIRSGSVDALVVRTPRGEKLFTLRGADQTYRALVEAMNEGALTLNNDMIAYCNHQFARMVHCPLEKIFGTPAGLWIQSPEFSKLLKGLRKGSTQRQNVEAVVRTINGEEVPALVSASRFSTEGKPAICLVVTDISERKRAERARHEMSRRIVNAQELERQRVARDLHDGVNQLLSSAKYRLSTAAQQQPGAARKSADQARMLVEKAIAEVRLICRNLRPSELDDLGLLAALRSLTHEFRTQHRIAVRFRSDLATPLPSETEAALYRIAQEALNNVARHAQATRTDLSIGIQNGEVLLMVRDNGQGLRQGNAMNGSGGWGLKNMRERASLLGGTCAVSQGRGKGTVVLVRIPLAVQGPLSY